MKTKTLFIALFFFMLAAAHAQDRYEYAVIDYSPVIREMAISINGSEFKKIEIAKADIKDERDASAALKEIKNMSMDGWEVFSTNTVGAGEYSWKKSYIFFLRRKAR